MQTGQERLFNPFLMVGAAIVIVVGVAVGYLLSRPQGSEPRQTVARSQKQEETSPKTEPLPTPVTKTGTGNLRETDVAASSPSGEISTPTRIRGIVYNAETGATLQGVTVLAHRVSGGSPLRDKTDVNGQFRFDDPQPGKWVLEAEGRGYASLHVASYDAVITLSTGEEIQDVALRVIPSATLEVKVLSLIGKTVPGAQVYIYAGRNKKGERISASPIHRRQETLDTETFRPENALAVSVADGSGVCRFDALEPGTYDLIAFATGLARQILQNVPTGTNEKEFRLEPEVRVTGKVLLSSTRKPVAAATVTVRFESDEIPPSLETVLTDASGEYRIGGLPKHSSLDIQAVSGETESSVYSLLFRGAALEHRRDILIVDDREIKGKVTDAYDGKPIPGAEVWVRNRLGTRKMTETGPDGWFTVKTGIHRHEIQLKKEGRYKETGWIAVLFKGEMKKVLLPPIKMEAGVPLSGQVVDKNSKIGLVGALVTAVPARGAGLPSDEGLTAVTGKGGKFEFPAVPPGKCYVSAECSGYLPGVYSEPDSSTNSIRPSVEIFPDVPLTDIRIALAPAPVLTVAGKVQSETGEGISSVEVSLIPEGRGGEAETPLSVFSEEKGVFRLEEVPMGRYTLVATLEGYWPAGIESLPVLPKKAPRDLVLILEKKENLTLSGRVTDAQGNPLPGAKVWCLLGNMEALLASKLLTPAGFLWLENLEQTKEGDSSTFQGVTVQTDGTYKITGLRSGTYALGANLPDAAAPPRFNVPAGSNGIDFVISTGGIIGGIVYHSDGQTPCPLFKVQVSPVSGGVMPASLKPDSEQVPPGTKIQVFQSTDGRFEFTGLSDGIYTLSVQSDTAGEAHLFGIQVGPQFDSSNLAVVLNEGGVIWGTVVDPENRPLEGAVVRLGEVVKETWEDGGFEFGGLVPDQYALTIQYPGYAVKTVGNLVLQPGAAELDVGTIRMSPGGTLEGRVRYAQGAGVPGMVVEVETPDGLSVPVGEDFRPASARTDSDGYFTISGLAEREYRLVLRQPAVGRNQAYSRYGVEVQSRLVRIREEETTGVEFVLDDGVRFSGSVTVQGKPLGRSTIVLYPRSETEVQEYLAVTDPWGNFSFPGVPPGEYEAVIAEFSPVQGLSRSLAITVPGQPSYRHDIRF